MEPPRFIAGSQTEADAAGNTQRSSPHPLLSKKVSDHLANFLHIRANIDRDAFHPPVHFVVLLTILASLIGLLLAVYLILTV